MRRQVLFQIPTLLWFAAFGTIASAAESLSLKISTAAENVSTDADVIVTAALTNVSGRTINLDYDAGAGVLYKVEIRNNDGDMALESGYALRHKNGAWSGSAGLFPLKPAQTLTTKLDMNDFFDLSHPGAYSIEVWCHYPYELGQGQLRSNTIVLTVSPPARPAAATDSGYRSASVPLAADGQATETVDGLSLSIEPDATTVLAGRVIRIGTSLTNRSGHEIAVETRGSPDADYVIDVRDADGNPAAESGAGKSRSKALAAGDASSAKIKVAAGGKIVGDIVVSQYFDMTKPSAYTIQLSRKGQSGSSDLRSNQVTITVKPRGE